MIAITVLEVIWYISCLLIVAWWLYRDKWGRRCFVKAPTKGHKLSAIDVAIILCLFLFVMAAAEMFRGEDKDNWKEQNLFYTAMTAGQLLIAFVVIMIAKTRFDDGLRGFGLRLLQWKKTTLLAVFYFFLGTGLAFLALTVTLNVCQALGYEQVQKHSTLEMLGDNPPLLTLILLVISPAVVAPILEELLFRGILQSYLVDLSVRLSNRENVMVLPQEAIYKSRWLGIILSSFLFAMFHQWQHWPALFVLSLCFGYSYERHKNLLIPMLAHSLFNILPLTLTLFGLAS